MRRRNWGIEPEEEASPPQTPERATMERPTPTPASPKDADEASETMIVDDEEMRRIWLQVFAEVDQEGGGEDDGSLTRKEFIRVIREFPILAAKLRSLLRLPEEFKSEGALAHCFSTMDLDSDTIDHEDYVVAKAILRRFDGFRDQHRSTSRAAEPSNQQNFEYEKEEDAESMVTAAVEAEAAAVDKDSNATTAMASTRGGVSWRRAWRNSILRSVRELEELDKMR